jgi:hypothetical protein
MNPIAPFTSYGRVYHSKQIVESFREKEIARQRYWRNIAISLIGKINWGLAVYGVC